jgi:hypothetical protein
MTTMLRFSYVPVFALTLYFIVKVLLPAVRPVIMTDDDILKIGIPPDAACTISWYASSAATVVAPDTANDANADCGEVLLDSRAVMMTKARVPVVTVTAGPAVVKSV